MKGIALSVVAVCLGAVSFNTHAVSCENVPQWNSSSVYTNGMQVQEAQKLYKANWWTQNQNPTNYSGQWQEWTLLGNCDPVGNRPPVAVLTVTQPSSSSTGDFWILGYLNLDGSGSYDPDNQPITYSWDGVNFSNVPSKTVSIPRVFDNCFDMYQTFTLTVKDSQGATSTATKQVLTNPADTSNPSCRSSSSNSSASSSSSTSGNSAPVARITMTDVQLIAGQVPVSASGHTSTDADGDPLTFKWEMDTGDESTGVSVNYLYAYPGNYRLRLTVSDGKGGTNSTIAFLTVAPAPSSSMSSHSSTSSVPSSRSSSSSSVSQELPKHALIGYWHNFNNGSGVIPLADVDDVWDVIVIAFADDIGNGSVSFNLDPVLNKAQFIADVAAKRAQGKKVVLSFGGQNGTVTLNSAANVTNFVNSTAAILNEYGFNGIDIDLESGANVSWGAPVIGNLVAAVKQLKQQFPDLYLSMAPEHPYVQGGMIAATGIWGAYLPIIDGLRDELDVLHVQLYNNGSMATPYSSQPLQAGTVDFMVASIKMLVEGFPVANNTQFVGLRPDQVALGVPSGYRSAGSGFVSVANLNTAVNCLAKLQGCGTIVPSHAYSDFRGVMTWSINWDVADGRPFSIPVNSNLDALP